LGDRIYVSARERPHRGGCYAEEIVIREDESIKVPDSVDMEAVATLANYQVAWHLLWNMARIKRGDTILVFAAAGGVGSSIVQLALIAGANIIGVASGEAKGKFLQELGAADVIDRSKEDINSRVKEITNGRGVDFVFDPIGGPQTADKLSTLAPLGTSIVYGRLAGPMDGDFAHSMRERLSDSIGIRSFSIHAFDKHRPNRMEATDALMALLSDHLLKPHIHARLPLSEAQRAHEMLEAGTVLGKILLKP
ncbi:MAG: quinone oxidoreductase family protein, partial [Methyloligellaceae bacterium]